MFIILKYLHVASLTFCSPKWSIYRCLCFGLFVFFTNNIVVISQHVASVRTILQICILLN